MFNVGGWEFLVILVLALVVLGPDKLPEAARQFGKYSGQFRQMARGFQKELDAVKSEFVELSDLSEAQARANGAAAVKDNPGPFDNKPGSFEKTPGSNEKPGPRGNMHKFESAEPAQDTRADDASAEQGEEAPPAARPTFDASTARPDRTEKPVAKIADAKPAGTETSAAEAAGEELTGRPKLDGTEMI